ncbi:Gfo/Idh/MocA family oxidoreductase [Kiritimatiellota bacterium B12222]|nr:Gfo/Idh/MocA family oxidoreductase [Kiritimatiellota bacterium B12222]
MPTHAHSPLHLLPRDHSPVRVALAGLGSMGVIHLKALTSLQAGISEAYYKADLPQQIKRMKICALCDPDLHKQQNFPNIPFYQEWQTLLQEQQPHIALIASPTLSHFELASQALDAGVHTLVEKPITPTLQECQTLIHSAATHGCRLLAGHVERYNPVAIKLHHLINDEGLQIRQYRFERTQAHPSRIPDDIIIDKLIHDLDLVHYLFGSVQKVEVRSSRIIKDRIMEMEVSLLHEEGVRGQLFVSWLVPDDAPKCRQVHLQSTTGDLFQGDFIQKRLSVNDRDIACDVQGWIAPANNQIKDQLVDFFAYCLAPPPQIPPPLLSPQEMEESIRIIEHIRSISYHV